MHQLLFTPTPLSKYDFRSDPARTGSLSKQRYKGAPIGRDFWCQMARQPTAPRVHLDAVIKGPRATWLERADRSSVCFCQPRNFRKVCTLTCLQICTITRTDYQHSRIRVLPAIHCLAKQWKFTYADKLPTQILNGYAKPRVFQHAWSPDWP